MVSRGRCDVFIGQKGHLGVCPSSSVHTGLKKAIGTVFQGASWQRCRVHQMRTIPSIVPRASQEMVASVIRTIFAQPDAKHVQAQFDEGARMLERSHSKVAQVLHDARGDLLAFCGFPPKHWRQIWSTNPIERLNKEIKRQTSSSAYSPVLRRCSALPALSSSSNTTSGKPQPAATCRRAPFAKMSSARAVERSWWRRSASPPWTIASPPSTACRRFSSSTICGGYSPDPEGSYGSAHTAEQPRGDAHTRPAARSSAASAALLKRLADLLLIAHIDRFL